MHVSKLPKVLIWFLDLNRVPTLFSPSAWSTPSRGVFLMRKPLVIGTCAHTPSMEEPLTSTLHRRRRNLEKDVRVAFGLLS